MSPTVFHQCEIMAKTICLFFCLGLATPAYAWDVSGHRLSAEIAYQNLSKCSRKHLENYRSELHKKYPFVRQAFDVAALPDIIKAKGDKQYNKWHYYARPWYPVDARVYRKTLVPTPNAFTALHFAKTQFLSSQVSDDSKAFYLSFIMHIIADMHQPLHNISRFDPVKKRLDAGGLRFRIRHGKITNLHRLWDVGVDHFGEPSRQYPFRRQHIQAIAKTLQARFPRTSFESELKLVKPMAWSHESFEIAKTVSYATPYGKRPSQAYLDDASLTAQMRLVLSGYRTAQYIDALIGKRCR